MQHTLYVVVEDAGAAPEATSIRRGVTLGALVGGTLGALFGAFLVGPLAAIAGASTTGILGAVLGLLCGGAMGGTAAASGPKRA